MGDPENAPIGEPLRATLRFLAKMTLEPQQLDAEDARAVLETGVTKEALEEAIQVAFLFNVYDRLADSLGWHVPEPSSGFFETSARRLLEKGYR